MVVTFSPSFHLLLPITLIFGPDTFSAGSDSPEVSSVAQHHEGFSSTDIDSQRTRKKGSREIDNANRDYRRIRIVRGHMRETHIFYCKICPGEH